MAGPTPNSQSDPAPSSSYNSNKNNNVRSDSSRDADRSSTLPPFPAPAQESNSTSAAPPLPKPTDSAVRLPQQHPLPASVTSHSTFASPSAAMAGPTDEPPSSSERQPLLRPDPESMGGDPAGGAGTRHRHHHHHHKQWFGCFPAAWRSLSRKPAQTCLLLSTVLGLIALIFSVVFVIHNRTSPPPHISHRGGGGWTRPGPIDHPPEPGEQLRWYPQPACRDGANRVPDHFFPVSFDRSTALNITQAYTTRHSPWGRSPHVWGDLIVRPVEGDARPGISVEIFNNDDDLLQVDLIWTDDGDRHGRQALSVEVPRSLPWHAEGEPCVEMRITLWTPSSPAALKSLDIVAVALDVSFLPGARLDVAETAFVSTVIGDVRIAADDDRPVALGSRDVSVETVSGDITGPFTLYDGLKLHSVSGDIDAQLGLAPVDDDKPLPAKLSVSTVSGHIVVAAPICGHDNEVDDVAARDYRINLRTVSGSMSGRLPFGSSCTINSISGNVDMRLLPVLAVEGEDDVTLRTGSRSGGLRLVVLEPQWVHELPTGPSEDENGLDDLAPENSIVAGLHACGCAVADADSFEIDGLDSEDLENDYGPEMDGAVPIFISNVEKVVMPDYDRENKDGIEALVISLVEEGIERWREKENHAADGPGLRHRDVSAERTCDNRSGRPSNQPPLRRLVSEHDTVSGKMWLAFPGSWEGIFSGQSMTGKLSVSGAGVEVDDSEDGFRKSLHGGKGPDRQHASRMRLDTFSGDASVVIGKDE